MANPYNGVDWAGVARFQQMAALMRNYPQLRGGGGVQAAHVQQYQPLFDQLAQIANGNTGPGVAGLPQGIPWALGGNPQWNAAGGGDQPGEWNPQPAAAAPAGAAAGQAMNFNNALNEAGQAAEHPEIDLYHDHFLTMVFTPDERPIEVLLDTGAGLSFASAQKIRQHWGNVPRKRLPQQVGSTGVGGFDQMSHEYVTVMIKLKAEADFGFIETKAHIIVQEIERAKPIILGLDYLRQNRLTMHWDEPGGNADWLEWGGLKVPRILPPPRHPY